MLPTHDVRQSILLFLVVDCLAEYFFVLCGKKSYPKSDRLLEVEVPLSSAPSEVCDAPFPYQLFEFRGGQGEIWSWSSCFRRRLAFPNVCRNEMLGLIFVFGEGLLWLK